MLPFSPVLWNPIKRISVFIRGCKHPRKISLEQIKHNYLPPQHHETTYLEDARTASFERRERRYEYKYWSSISAMCQDCNSHIQFNCYGKNDPNLVDNWVQSPCTGPYLPLISRISIFNAHAKRGIVIAFTIFMTWFIALSIIAIFVSGLYFAYRELIGYE
jgi:hypothetical protein